eukprot:1177559-Prorocentrum_minimum.AAC.1
MATVLLPRRRLDEKNVACAVSAVWVGEVGMPCMRCALGRRTETGDAGRTKGGTYLDRTLHLLAMARVLGRRAVELVDQHRELDVLENQVPEGHVAYPSAPALQQRGRKGYQSSMSAMS